MIKILHTADIHLGAKFSGLGRSGDRVRAQLKKTFMKVIDLALEKNVDLLLVAGDLFNSNQISRATLGFILGEFARLGKIHVCLVPGTHDCYDNSSIYRNIEPSLVPPNFHLLVDEENPFVFFEDLGVTVYGRPNRSNRGGESPLPALNQEFNSRFNLALAHGSFQIPSKSQEDDFPITLEELEKSGFDYVALGHWHSTQEVCKKPLTYYSGSPEQLKFGEKDSGNVLLIELNEGLPRVEKIKTGELKWQEMELELDKFKNPSELLREIEKYEGEQNILKVRFKENLGLKGFSEPGSGEQDFSRLKEVLDDQFLHLELEQMPQPLNSDISSKNLPQHTVTGQFLKIMEEKISSANEENREKYQQAKILGYLYLSGKEGI
ncbi:MAG: DNA repair exonuclease [candidate division Zixibacteria bacterium]|nr:DNA repair exonuclease [candidate division Zixibacteria bacterium]